MTETPDQIATPAPVTPSEPVADQETGEAVPQVEPYGTDDPMRGPEQTDTVLGATDNQVEPNPDYQEGMQ